MNQLYGYIHISPLFFFFWISFSFRSPQKALNIQVNHIELDINNEEDLLSKVNEGNLTIDNLKFFDNQSRKFLA